MQWLLMPKSKLFEMMRSDSMLFMHLITWLFMQINALIIINSCMLSSFKHISIILCKFML